MKPPFTMSKYATEATLHKDKAAYYEQLAQLMAINAANDKLSDAEFRQMVRDTIPEFAPAPAAPAGNRPTVGITPAGVPYLCVEGKPTFDLTTKTHVREGSRPVFAATRPATMSEIQAWRRVAFPDSFLDLNRPPTGK